jgi:hypothetical protein
MLVDVLRSSIALITFKTFDMCLLNLCPVFCFNSGYFLRHSYCLVLTHPAFNREHTKVEAFMKHNQSKNLLLLAGLIAGAVW